MIKELKKANEVYIPNFYVSDIVSNGESSAKWPASWISSAPLLSTVFADWSKSCYKLITTLQKSSISLIHHLQTGDECSNDLPILWVLERQGGSYRPNVFMTWGLAEAAETVEMFSKNYFLFFNPVSSHEDSFFYDRK